MPACDMCQYDPAAVVVQSWTFRVQSYCPTHNTLGGNTKNAHKYRTWRNRWSEEFGPWLKQLPPAQKLRRVTITRMFGKGKRAFDRINFAAGQKPLLDTLTNYGAIYDDNALWCQDHYLQLKSPDGNDYIEVLIEEL